MAVEVVNLSYYGEPEQSIEEDDDNCEEDDDNCEDDEESGMVPTTSSSIESLKTKQVGAKKLKEICTICLDQFSVGVKVVQMPCVHTFHRDCIVSWLERSHVCPLCRFEMPI
ncbi:E3 ubiquitin-protein ligase RING1-like [Aristolochia californica]|uniref:E3 ubiquitin-protein ligase RING1-like n=1 Tax=Aristolochia californica TaxID=171875 RepID=UPI0035D7087E